MKSEALDLCDLIAKFGDDQSCRKYLEHLRWPEGMRCPKCNGGKISSILKRGRYNCDTKSCGYQFSVTAGTVLHDTHLPLAKWFLATYLLCRSRREISANQLKRMLGINYRTAWYLCHRIRHAVQQSSEARWEDAVKLDDTDVDGNKMVYSLYPSQKAKEAEKGFRERGGGPIFFHAEDAKSGALAKYIKENINADVDGRGSSESSDALRRDGADNHGYRQVNIYTNNVESAVSLLEHGIRGTWHRVSAEHLPAYLREVTWRFNNRKNPYLFRDTILRLLMSDKLEYKRLTSKAA